MYWNLENESQIDIETCFSTNIMHKTTSYYNQVFIYLASWTNKIYT